MGFFRTINNKLQSALTSEYPANVAFLGFADRVNEIREGHPIVWKQNILGLSLSRVFPVFPVNLRNVSIVLGFYSLQPAEETILEFRGDNGQTPFQIRMKLQISEVAADGTQSQIHDQVVQASWRTVVTPLNADVMVFAPGLYRIFLQSAEGERHLADTYFIHAPFRPLGAEDIAAIKSDPLAMKHIRLHVGCNACGSLFKTYTAIERSEDLEKEGWQWSQTLSADHFTCSCKKVSFELQFIRSGLHGMLRRNLNPAISSVFSADRLYEKSGLEQSARDFLTLIDAQSKEEALQKFLEANPIFFHRFAPKKLYHKPAILTKFFADFIILTERNELLLIEIEKPHTRLVKQDGGKASELEHAFHQIRTWMEVVNDHRAAFLDSLELQLSEVAKVSGVVIAGRNPDNKAHLRLLRSVSSADLQLFTYDDMLSAVTELIKQVANL